MIEFANNPSSVNNSIANTFNVDFTERGVLTAQLAAAALTESNYQPVIDGGIFSLTPPQWSWRSNSPGQGYNSPSNIDGSVINEAASVVREAIHNHTPGTKRIKLAKFDTQYARAFRELGPHRKTTPAHRELFEESFVLKAREIGIWLGNPQEGYEIIKRAPRTIQGLLADNLPKPQHHTEPADALRRYPVITKDGKLIYVNRHDDYYYKLGRNLFFMSGARVQIPLRGGFVPDSRDIEKLKETIVKSATGVKARRNVKPTGSFSGEKPWWEV